MKIAIIAIIALLGCAFAQDDLDESFDAKEEWPQNEFTNAGALIDFVYADIGSGSCIVELPSPVNLFHVMNGHIVPGDETSPIEGRYKISAPAGWEAINGTLSTLLLFARDDIFNLTEVTFSCDAADEEDLSVYSFPQNNLVKEASSNVHKRSGFHVGDVLTITLPAPVARFNITGADSEWVITEDDDGLTYTVSGFKNEEGIDDQKEVHFSLDYEDAAGDGANWFSAGDVTVAVSQEEPSEPAP